MNSFNVYGQTEQKVGGNTPIWLGTVKPIPRGATISVSPGQKVEAGKLCIYDPQNNSVSVVNALGSGMEAEANAYIYNDVNVENPNGGFSEMACTCAVVMHHPEGLLIERVYPDITEEQIQTLQAKIPGVLLVRG